MTPREIVVVGAGGFARETLDVIEALQSESTGRFSIVGVTDRSPSEGALALLTERGVKWLGDDESWLARACSMEFVVGIGSPSIRRRLADRYTAMGHQPATLIHPRAVIGTRTSIQHGSVVCAGVQISTNVKIGAHVHLNPNATIGHDARLDDFASINPGAVISGSAWIHEEVLVGAGAVVLERLEVGCRATVGAAACVVRDVAPGATVKGVPAR